ncbi:MAG: aa3-type cytochrome c oxidase subunit IV [Pseudomonadota bacterium]
MADDPQTPDAKPYEPGKMDITEHEKTFEGFMRLGSIAFTLAILALIFLALVNA